MNMLAVEQRPASLCDELFEDGAEFRLIDL